MNKILALIKTAECMTEEIIDVITKDAPTKENIIHILKLAIEALEKE